ncbi:Alpha/Beta hydrolase protein [Stachybotrys elegans]|uniref:Alpha/Beta hydrolase protein n=1 Tax=Stachybotrys elegans TaxID=80388 RepID=A0A8K0WV21_9HYPO|nr:Alpha/Beta hydrolase protein [Stachybotrys elegans]
MADVELAKTELAKTKKLSTWHTARHPNLRGLPDPKHRDEISGPLLVHKDVAIPARDGTILRGNIYRPRNRLDERLPVIVNYSVYGKDGGTDVAVFPSSCGLDPARITREYIFEAADPLWWGERGYIVASVDARGSYQSDGDKSYYSRDVGLDGYDVVEWLGSQTWSNGRVSLYGASAYAMLTWLIAAEQPPSLAAIIPIDGMTDLYREMIYKGGIREVQFNLNYANIYDWGRGQVENYNEMQLAHPFFDEYWQSKIPRLANIVCPTYIICGWGDHGIHTRGTLHAYKTISSKIKYLELHQCQKWEWSVTEESLARQKAFLDTFMLGKSTEVQFWPKVRYTMRERFYSGEWRHADTFPFPETKYTQFYPTPSKGLSRIAQPVEHSISYDAATEEIELKLPAYSSFEMAGHSKVKLWVEAQGNDDLDLFITLRKRDANGNDVYFPWLTIMVDGPVGFGWLRTSRRELDEAKSTPWQPYHAHQRSLPLKAGEIVPVEIEIQPTSCRLRAGEELVLVISGHDYHEYPKDVLVCRHEMINKGKAVVHFGGKYDSHLQLPIIPPVSDAYMDHKKPKKMNLIGRRVTGWSDEKFCEEYCSVHGGMTSRIASVIPMLRGYAQIVSLWDEKQQAALPGSASAPWDCLSSLTWTSIDALAGSLQHPQYKATAGSHVFLEEEDIIGVLTESFVDDILDPVLYKQRQGGAMVGIMLAGAKDLNADKLEEVLANRAANIRAAVAGTELLRYVLSKRVLAGEAAKAVFRDSPFENFEWSTMVALEQYWLPSKEAALRFLEAQAKAGTISTVPSGLDMARSVAIVGDENCIVAKDHSI